MCVNKNRCVFLEGFRPHIGPYGPEKSLEIREKCFDGGLQGACHPALSNSLHGGGEKTDVSPPASFWLLPTFVPLALRHGRRQRPSFIIIWATFACRGLHMGKHVFLCILGSFLIRYSFVCLFLCFDFLVLFVIQCERWWWFSDCSSGWRTWRTAQTKNSLGGWYLLHFYYQKIGNHQYFSFVGM